MYKNINIVLEGLDDGVQKMMNDSKPNHSLKLETKCINIQSELKHAIITDQ